MDLEKKYFDANGNLCNISQMIEREPDWAANRLQLGELAIKRLTELEEWPLKRTKECKACKGMKPDSFGHDQMCIICGKHVRGSK